MPRIGGNNRQQKQIHSLQIFDVSDTDFKTTILHVFKKIKVSKYLQEKPETVTNKSDIIYFKRTNQNFYN